MPFHLASLTSLGSTIGLAFPFAHSAGSRKKARQHWCLRPSPVGSPTPEFRPMEQFGSPRFLGSPLVALPCSLDPGPATLATATGQVRYRPRQTDHEGRSILAFSRLIHIASLLAVYASSFGFPALARLTSGRVAALTGWDSNPLDSYGEFQSGFTSPSIPTPQA
jgi:hypothetical protein